MVQIICVNAQRQTCPLHSQTAPASMERLVITMATRAKRRTCISRRSSDVSVTFPRCDSTCSRSPSGRDCQKKKCSFQSHPSQFHLRDALHLPPASWVEKWAVQAFISAPSSLPERLGRVQLLHTCAEHQSRRSPRQESRTAAI